MNLHLWETTTSLQKVIFFLDLIGPNLNTHQTFIIQLWNEGSGLEVTMSSPIWTSHSLLSFINNFYQMDEYLWAPKPSMKTCCREVCLPIQKNSRLLAYEKWKPLWSTKSQDPIANFTTMMQQNSIPNH